MLDLPLGSIIKLDKAGVSKSSNESSYTPNLTEITKHTGGDVRITCISHLRMMTAHT